MPDLVRAYRVWVALRLAVIVPAFLAAAGLAVREGARLSGDSAWIHAACLGLALFLSLFSAWMGWRCAVLLARSGRRMYLPARQIRRELSLAGPIALVSLSISTLLFVLPASFQPPSEPSVEGLVRVETVGAPAGRSAFRTRVIPIASADGPAFSTPASNFVPQEAETHVREEAASGFAVRTHPALFSEHQDEEEFDTWTLDRPPLLNRMGVPEAGSPFPWMLPELRVLAFLVQPKGTFLGKENNTVSIGEDLDMNGGGLQILFDLALSPDNSLRFLYQAIGLTLGDISEAASQDVGESFTIWQRFGVFLVHRFAGYTSESTVDFALSVGLIGDSLITAAHGGIASEALRVSPYLGAELALWQQGPSGLILRASQTIPMNLTGVNAMVTEISALLRLDVSKALALHVGYLAIWATFNRFPQGLNHKGRVEELDLFLHGPTLGIDLRF